MKTVPIDATLEAAPRRDRQLVAVALAGVVALSWVYLIAGAGMDMSAPRMTRAIWTPGHAAQMFFMWWLMMLAMMLPGAAPMILLFATVNRRQRETGRPCVATCIFVFGYLVAWAGFSLVAVILQWGLQHAGILTPTLVVTDAISGGFLLLAAGIYQLTPIKHVCLRRCRSPLAFLGTHWRPGAGGALHMGLLHGAYCVGCCWCLMGLILLGGAMDLYWMAGLALFVLCEKALPVGHWLGRATGVALLAWGAGMLVLAC